MPSFDRRWPRVPLLLAAALGFASARTIAGCGTQPCFRHSDCASTEICSLGQCVLAPVDMPIDLDGGLVEAALPANDGGQPGVDVSVEAPPNVPDVNVPDVSSPDADAAPDAETGADASDASADSSAE
jgi:hypothetical protein